VKSVSYTPAYIYIIAMILALPATWLTVGVAGEDVPGMVGMVVTLVYIGVFTLALSSLRRRLHARRQDERNSSGDLS